MSRGGAALRRPLDCEFLLCLESEIRGSRLAGGHRHFLRLGSILFLPCGNCVASRWHVVDGVVATLIRSSGGSLHDNMPAVHPRMNVALHCDCYFRMGPTGLD